LSSAKIYEQGNSSENINNSVMLRRKKTTAPTFNVNKSPLSKTQNRKQALEARGVSIIYHQSATTKHRREKGDVDASKSGVSVQPTVAATSGGSVVVRRGLNHISTGYSMDRYTHGFRYTALL
jgi:hypothetical protein